MGSRFKPDPAIEHNDKSKYLEAIVKLLTVLHDTGEPFENAELIFVCLRASFEGSNRSLDQALKKFFNCYGPGWTSARLPWGLEARRKLLNNKAWIPTGFDWVPSNFDSSLTREGPNGAIHYDPFFVLPMICSLLESVGSDGVEAAGIFKRLIQMGLVAYTMKSLAHENVSVRKWGGQLLGELVSLVDKIPYHYLKLGRVILLILNLLKNTITEPNMILPCTFCSFAARALDLLHKPNHPAHYSVYLYILKDIALEMDSIPAFYSLLLGSKDKACQTWLVNTLAEGLTSKVDVELIEQSHGWRLLFAMHDSRLSGPKFAVGFFKLLGNALSLPYGFKVLVERHSLILWIRQRLAGNTTFGTLSNHMMLQLLDKIDEKARTNEISGVMRHMLEQLKQDTAICKGL